MKRNLAFVGAHLGYPMDKTPLGGGAMVGLQLARHWAGRPDFRLIALGSGPQAPARGLDYVRLPEGGAQGQGLVKFSEFEYARFCRRFEKATTDWILERRAELDPRETVVVVNDVSEGPTLSRLTAAGYPIVSLWHVDVVDYFNRMYLKDMLAPERLTKLYERLRRAGPRVFVPDVLKLVFEKQRETVAHSSRMIFPSKAMAETVRRCYGPKDFGAKGVVVPWGVWPAPAVDAAAEAAKLRRHYQLRPDSTVLMTLSRISPEKGIHLLLEALRRLEAELRPGEDLCLFVCGEPAFMQGAAYMAQVRRAAAKLKKTRVFFPGYLCAESKQAYYRLADLFVSPSVHDSYGLNIVEAMQAGLPILASDHYGVRDILEPEFGRKVRYESLRAAPEGLAGALRYLLADKEHLKEMGRLAAVAAASSPFSTAAERVLSLSMELLKKEPAGVLR
jgi:glycosyltransferase involved in cell wall biosynthesis